METTQAAISAAVKRILQKDDPGLREYGVREGSISVAAPSTAKVVISDESQQLPKTTRLEEPWVARPQSEPRQMDSQARESYDVPKSKPSLDMPRVRPSLIDQPMLLAKQNNNPAIDTLLMMRGKLRRRGRRCCFRRDDGAADGGNEDRDGNLKLYSQY